MIFTCCRLVALATVAIVFAAAPALARAAASGAIPPAHGHPIEVVKPSFSHRGASTKAANETYNWFGYELDALTHPGQTYHAVAGTWTVPLASAHSVGETEASSDWVGVGGSCINSDCSAVDSTLIQAGTEQDVDTAGQPSYYAWWEGLPAYEQRIPSLSVSPGDQIYASLSTAVGSNSWTISLRDLTSGESYTNQVSYTSAYTSAEWIEEATTVVDNNKTFTALPNLSTIPFSQEVVNGAPADLSTASEDLLVDKSQNVIGAPSALDGNVFNECAWASACASPTIPVSLAPPTISGSPVIGQTLSEAHGSWTRTPSSYSYQWERCDGGGGACQAIPGATSERYKLSTLDGGHTIRVEESASNAAGGGAPAPSGPTAVVTAPSPTLAPIDIADAKRELRRALEARYHGEFSHRYRYAAKCSKTGSETVVCHVFWRHQSARFAGRVKIRWYLRGEKRRWRAGIKVRRSATS